MTQAHPEKEMENTATRWPTDPPVPPWQELSLQDTWADGLDPRSLRGWVNLLRSLFARRQPVRLPEDFAFEIPKYVLQEFHNLPNGNYSNRLTRGYITGFDMLMLGHADKARDWIADKLGRCASVLDIGTAGGKTAAAVRKRGVTDVWAIDPSPYLLKHAAQAHPEVHFVQGLVEDLPFARRRFDGIAACFVFHEIPPRFIRHALRGLNRTLRRGGQLAVAEPSSLQIAPCRTRDFLSLSGWRRLYFHALASFVHEPFVDAWHKLDKSQLFGEFGFALTEQHREVPTDLLCFEKVGEL